MTVASLRIAWPVRISILQSQIRWRTRRDSCSGSRRCCPFVVTADYLSLASPGLPITGMFALSLRFDLGVTPASCSLRP
jgi:hypothetical protein